MTENPRINDTAVSPVKFSILNGVMSIVLNQPKRANTLSIGMMEAVISALDAAVSTPEVRVVMILGEGSVFCAGHDLKELTARRSDPDGGREFFRQTLKMCSEMMQKIVLLPKPVIAVVNGTATAAGCQLVATCDLALAAQSATFCTPGVHIGLFCSTPMVALSRNANRKQSMEMLLTGESVDAETAREYGLVNRVVQHGELESEAQKYGETIASKSAMTLKIGKEAFHRQLEMSLSDAYDYCAEVMVQNMMKEDAQEGITAFIEKKQPVWRDR